MADHPGGSRPDSDAVDGDQALPTGRHEARERAMHLLYEAEAKDLDLATVLDELPVAPDPFTDELVRGVGEHLDEVDAVLGEASKGWTVGRMPALDRAVLRLAAYELAHRPDVPTAVVIDEAVGLAKSYSTDDSGRFVNGVLATVARKVRPSA